MSWKKNSEAAVKRFDAIAAVPGAKRGVMFGCPVYNLGKERYDILFEEKYVLRLSPEDSAALIAKGGKPFEPIKGRKSKTALVVPAAVAKSERSLKAWLEKAVRFAQR